ncbi:MAG TPA: M20/M25/M40 family metallo-hydrolase [Candidatus Polarisedimenticolia bacterium]|jgi:glutamate carboxypeptidase|nr:M20/M25/M40 family metallo-hydrolase [Candidatus Polarisedimenticolia bacterium]
MIDLRRPGALRVLAWPLMAVGLAAAALPGGPARAALRAPAISSEEREIRRWVEQHAEEAEALLERAVNINSGTLNLPGVRKVGALFRAELDALGFKTRWVEGEAFHRAGHLLAERAGSGPRVLLIGHLDTVFEADGSFQRFERLEGDQARGPGVIDMKGGDVILLQALKALRAAGSLDGLAVTVVLTGDEENPGEPIDLSREALVRAAPGAQAALGFEDGDGKPQSAVVARRGSSSWVLRSTGKAAHSSQIFRKEIGAGAILEAARALDGFRKRLAGEPYLTFSPGILLGGTLAELEDSGIRGTASGKSNVVAGRVVVTGDLRALSPAQLRKAKAAMAEVAARHLPQTSSEIDFKDSYSPLAPSEGNRRLLGLYDRTSRDLGFGPVTATDPMEAGAADVSFVAGVVSMILDGIGLKGRGGHTAEETADLKMLSVQTQRAAVLLHRLSRGAAGAARSGGNRKGAG